MKVIESDKIVPLCRLFMLYMPKQAADALCKDIQELVDSRSIDVPERHGRFFDNSNYVECYACGAEVWTSERANYCPVCGEKLSLSEMPDE